MNAAPTPAGAPCWLDLTTSDLAKAKDFYAALLGWTYETGDAEKYGGYVTAAKDGKTVAGMMGQMPGSQAPDAWTPYLLVENIQAVTEAVTAHGGQVLLPPMEVPDQGHMAIIADPAGAAVGVWQTTGHPGFGLHGQPGSAVWHELHTQAYPAAVDFYEKVFGWQTEVLSDTADFRYTTQGSGPDATAGIMDATVYLPPEVPSHWQTYFGVEDTDAAVEVAVRHGAQVLRPASDSPFGRSAALSDPTGAAFNINQELPAG